VDYLLPSLLSTKSLQKEGKKKSKNCATFLAVGGFVEGNILAQV
jgi:hypothetical protein